MRKKIDTFTLGYETFRSNIPKNKLSKLELFTPVKKFTADMKLPDPTMKNVDFQFRAVHSG